MPFDSSNFLSCSYGQAPFMLSDYSVRRDATIKANLGRVSTKIAVKGDGFIEAASMADLQVALNAVYSAFDQGGLDLKINGLGGANEFTLPAAVCADYGPHVLSFELKSSSSALRKLISFELSADVPYQLLGAGGPPQPNQPPPATTPAPLDSFTVKASTRPDGLRTITRSGEVNGIDSGTYFVETLLPSFQDQYQGGGWVTSFDYDVATSDPKQAKTSYTFTAIELAENFPNQSSNPDSPFTIVDGEAHQRKERDEQMRLVTTYDYDFTITGDPLALHNWLRPDDAPIVKESYDASVHKEVRVRSSFTQLDSGEGDDLLNWSQTINWQRDMDTYEEITFPGAAPIAIKKPQTFGRVTQSGSATGLRRFPKAPQPVCPTLVEPTDISVQDVNNNEKQTTWRYLMFLQDPVKNDEPTFEFDSIGRPGKPDFYNQPSDVGQDFEGGGGSF